MKKLVVAAAFLATLVTANAQSEKFVGAMEPLVKAIDTTRSVGGFTSLSNSFERIGSAEKTQWLPYYYAALTTVSAGYNNAQSGNTGSVDAMADKAEGLLKTAKSLTTDNSELHLLNKMIITLRVMVDPMSRYQDLQKASDELDMAKKLNPENPRVYLNEGQDKFYTPEQFGGSKEEAKKLFAKSVEKFKTFKPASSIDPQWGAGQADYFLKMAGE